jgi:hypothetical protein
MNADVIALATNKQICEAVGCSNFATNEIKLDIGKYGNISLFLCIDCLPKFSTKGVKIRNAK